MYSELRMCEDCGAFEKCWLVNDEWVCADCLERMGYIQCVECGDWLRETHALYNNDGDAYCETCFYKNYTVCEDCGEIMEIGEEFTMQSRYGEKYVCANCIDDYHQCMDCGDYFEDNEMYNDGRHGHWLCISCYESHDWRECDECGVFISYDEQNWDEDNENCYCDDCYNEIAREHNYSYKPDPVFHCTERERGANTLYFGVEDEVDDGDSKGKCIEELKEIIGEDHLYCKHDGSLSCDGFEMVSHPMTLAYHMKEMPWKDVFECNRSYGFNSHNTSTCGLHIHVGRKGLGESQEEIDDTIKKIVLLTERHWDKIVNFTRRREGALIQWAARPEIHEWYVDNAESMTADDARDEIGANYCCTRYTAINRCNRNTIEFRVFRGTLKYNTFIATLQFVNNICSYAKTHTWEDVFCSTWGDIVDFERFAELDEYLAERNLTPQRVDDRFVLSSEEMTAIAAAAAAAAVA